ncbi:hypothetical protein AAC387_Pa05g1342 [Persea americana]
MSSASSLNQTPKYSYPVNLEVGNIVSMKLKQSIYLMWRTQRRALVENQDMQGFLNGETPIPESSVLNPESTVADGAKVIPNLDYTDWRRTDQMLQSWITCTLSEDVLA